MDYKVTLAKNARCGDGCYWRHPECVNSKLVFTGINKDWLDYKGSLIERSATLRREANAKGAFANAKPMWEVVSCVDPVYTAYRDLSKRDILNQLDFDDLVLWFLDDGTTCTKRGKNVKKEDYKYLLCIGDFLSDLPGGALEFLGHMAKVFDTQKAGSICKNNSKASDRNLVWNMPVGIGRRLVAACRYLAVPGFERKLRTIQDSTSEIIPEGSRPSGLRLPKRGSLPLADKI
jgi:hypothetical protein